MTTEELYDFEDTRVGMLVASLLSDVQETIGWKMADEKAQADLNEQNRQRLNFAKWLTFQYENLNTWISSHKAEAEFSALFQ